MNVDEFPVEDVEKLRDELIDLSEKGEIKESKAFLRSKKCTEDVMKRIMGEYVEKRQRMSKMLMAISFVKLLPDLLEKFGALSFKGGHDKFSSKILADENTMFVIADMMPCCEGGGYYFKYFSALIFLSSLCYNDISFGFSETTSTHPDESPSPKKSDPEVVTSPKNEAEPENKTQ